MKTTALDSALAQMRGRYFGIERKNGTLVNAKVRKITPKFLIVEDRNARKDVKILKSTINSIRIEGRVLR